MLCLCYRQVNNLDNLIKTTHINSIKALNDLFFSIPDNKRKTFKEQDSDYVTGIRRCISDVCKMLSIYITVRLLIDFYRIPVTSNSITQILFTKTYTMHLLQFRISKHKITPVISCINQYACTFYLLYRKKTLWELSFAS